MNVHSVLTGAAVEAGKAAKAAAAKGDEAAAAFLAGQAEAFDAAAKLVRVPIANVVSADEYLLGILASTFTAAAAA